MATLGELQSEEEQLGSLESKYETLSRQPIPEKKFGFGGTAHDAREVLTQRTEASATLQQIRDRRQQLREAIRSIQEQERKQQRLETLRRLGRTGATINLRGLSKEERQAVEAGRSKTQFIESRSAIVGIAKDYGISYEGRSSEDIVKDLEIIRKTTFVTESGGLVSVSPEIATQQPDKYRTIDQYNKDIEEAQKRYKELKDLERSGDIAGFSGTRLTPEQIARKNLLEGIGVIPKTPTFGEFYTGETPKGKAFLQGLEEPSKEPFNYWQQYVSEPIQPHVPELPRILVEPGKRGLVTEGTLFKPIKFSILSVQEPYVSKVTTESAKLVTEGTYSVIRGNLEILRRAKVSSPRPMILSVLPKKTINLLERGNKIPPLGSSIDVTNAAITDALVGIQFTPLAPVGDAYLLYNLIQTALKNAENYSPKAAAEVIVSALPLAGSTLFRYRLAKGEYKFKEIEFDIEGAKRYVRERERGGRGRNVALIFDEYGRILRVLDKDTKRWLLPGGEGKLYGITGELSQELGINVRKANLKLVDEVAASIGETSKIYRLERPVSLEELKVGSDVLKAEFVEPRRIKYNRPKEFFPFESYQNLLDWFRINKKVRSDTAFIIAKYVNKEPLTTVKLPFEVPSELKGPITFFERRGTTFFITRKGGKFYQFATKDIYPYGELGGKVRRNVIGLMTSSVYDFVAKEQKKFLNKQVEIASGTPSPPVADLMKSTFEVVKNPRGKSGLYFSYPEFVGGPPTLSVSYLGFEESILKGITFRMTKPTILVGKEKGPRVFEVSTTPGELTFTRKTIIGKEKEIVAPIGTVEEITGLARARIRGRRVGVKYLRIVEEESFKIGEESFVSNKKIAFDLDNTLIGKYGQVRPNALKLLQDLKKNNNKLVLYSYSPKARTQSILGKTGLGKYFDEVISREDYANKALGEDTLKDIKSIGADLLIENRAKNVQNVIESGGKAIKVSTYKRGPSYSFKTLNKEISKQFLSSESKSVILKQAEHEVALTEISFGKVTKEQKQQLVEKRYDILLDEYSKNKIKEPPVKISKKEQLRVYGQSELVSPKYVNPYILFSKMEGQEERTSEGKISKRQARIFPSMKRYENEQKRIIPSMRTILPSRPRLLPSRPRVTPSQVRIQPSRIREFGEPIREPPYRPPREPPRYPPYEPPPRTGRPQTPPSVPSDKSYYKISGLLGNAFRTYIVRRRKKVFLPGLRPKASALFAGYKEVLSTPAATFGVIPTQKQVRSQGNVFKVPEKYFRPYVIKKGKKVPIVDVYIQKTKEEGGVPRGRFAFPSEQRLTRLGL